MRERTGYQKTAHLLSQGAVRARMPDAPAPIALAVVLDGAVDSRFHSFGKIACLGKQGPDICTLPCRDDAAIAGLLKAHKIHLAVGHPVGDHA